MDNSKFLQLKTADFWKGLITAILSAVTTALISVFTNLSDLKLINWNIVLIAGGAGFLGYIQKQLFTNSDGETFKVENK